MLFADLTLGGQYREWAYHVGTEYKTVQTCLKTVPTKNLKRTISSLISYSGKRLEMHEIAFFEISRVR